MEDKLNDFGEILINQVRNSTINTFYKMIDGKSKSTTGKKVYEKIANFDNENIDILKELILEVVDIELHNMLFIIEGNDDIKLFFEDEDLKEISDGLSGELYTEDGWIEKFGE